QIKQGWLERANVDLAREMVDMLAVMRIYEANQKAIQAADETLGKSVNEVGSLR
ncbi:MAG: flagellar biosynthesis protein FlgG, partial [Moorella humiferrea]|nr:flagellar biosynthesis protein FlgG [Moorella humiferrea]